MTPWGRACLALRLALADPAGGGLLIRARPGPAREALLALLPGPLCRLHPALTLEALEGGIDSTASLAAGTLVRHAGLLEARDRPFLLPMAERCPPLMANRLCAALDRGGQTLIALDEGAEPEEAAPAALTDRLAYHVTLEGLSRADLTAPPDYGPLALRPEQIHCPPEALEELVQLGVTLGITSLRAPGLALHSARLYAALNDRNRLETEDLLVAAELVLAPRATRLPADSPEEPEPPREAPEERGESPERLDLPQEILLEAIRTALPPDLLGKNGSNKGTSGSGSGAGGKLIGNRRGRPLGARASAPRGGTARIDLPATLRAALPYQGLRRAASPRQRPGPIIRASDLRYRRFEELSDRLLVFAVDGSGSAALARLAEAKGAVELLLSEAYARRDQVALLTFRGTGAELLLPPTRSLVQTKRRLADLPGGGGTPLAAGLDLGIEVALAARRRGLSPVLILLTDGRANVTRAGMPDRALAAEEAELAARQVSAQALDSIVIDLGRRPEAALRRLALTMGGRYLALPRADAGSLSNSITATLER